jgi:beta-lactamase class D
MVMRATVVSMAFAAVLPLFPQGKIEHSCVVVQGVESAQPLATRGDGCATRLSPASTFKIPHALVALETGAATLDGVERWDGTKYERQREWNRDHTLISALRPSVLWLFQRIAPRIGAPRMSDWLAKFEYGNRDVSGPITEYWINGRLQISAPEQVRFLRRFYKGDLPVQSKYLRAVRDGLEQKPGTVENALGVHPLAGDWHHAGLNSKTGATTTADYRVSWLVGLFRAADHREYVFASASWRQGAAVDTLDGARLAVATFADLGLLPRRVAQPGR